MRKESRRMIQLEVFIILAILVACCCASCRSERVIENTIVQHDTTYIDRMQRDSIWLHDSVYLHEYQRGETIYVEHTKWHTQWRDRVVHDSVYIAKTDTLVQTKIQEVEKKLNWWQRGRMTLGTIALGGLAVFAGIKLRKLFF